MSQRSLIPASALCKVFLICVALATCCAASDWNYEESHDQVRDFSSGGMVHLRMTVGDLHVKRGGSNQIRMHYTVKSWSESRVKAAHVDIDVNGRNANIEFHASTGGNTQFDVELEVPQNTNLDVYEKVGDLRIQDIEGDKDLELGVGDIRVASGRAAYHVVRASTSIGDVNGEGYGETSGWLGKTLKYEGNGKYELRAHVSIGDITLDEK
jgi:hypothetical protein